MELRRYQFDLLTFVDKHGIKKYSQRYLSDELTLSVGTMNKVLNESLEAGILAFNDDNELFVTDFGYEVLEQYRVKRAIILAAGFGSRLAPVTLNTPKPLVEVNGKRIIDTLLDALIKKGIEDIVVVVGYKKEQFKKLLKKYPTIKLVENNEYNITNNISSAMKAIDLIDRCYICEADLLILNPEIIRKYEYTSNFLAAKVDQTDDWCFKKVNGYINNYQQGGEDCYQMYGISYWKSEDCIKLKANLVKLYNSRAGKEKFWEYAALGKGYKKDFKIEIRDCHKSDIVEIDNFSELIALDRSYANYPGHEEF